MRICMDPENPAVMPRFAAWLSLSALIIIVDQASKFWISSSLHYREAVAVTPFFDIVLVLNPGAAFSFLSDASGWQRWFFVTLAAVISVWLIVLLHRHADGTLMAGALSMILGGALGNLIDRITIGAVVDFLYFHLGSHGFPAFNVADSCITVGVCLLVWEQMRGHGAPQEGTQ